MSDRLVTVTTVAKRWQVHPKTARSMLVAAGITPLRTQAGTEYVAESVVDALTASVRVARELNRA